LSEGLYADRPKARGNDWSRFARAPDQRLQRLTEASCAEIDEGGVQQQRHPGLAEEPVRKVEPPKQLDLLGLEQEEGDGAAEKRSMDRARGTRTIVRAHALNEGAGRDRLPSF
jgi:type IV secretion system protein VirD4